MNHLGFYRRIVLSGCIALSLCACSSDDDSGTDVDPSTEGDDNDETRDAGAGADDDEVEMNEDGVDPRPPLPAEVTLPIVFAHGFAGSAQQYESQAIRFAANGYPRERIKAYDHDGAGRDIAAYADGLDAVIDAALEEFDAEQVYLVGHSRGTSVSTSYLEDPARAAKVAKYIAIDGRPCPMVVPCIAPNQAGHPGQAHVEVATSKESFIMQYEFLIGETPEVVDIVAQRKPVEISGRAVNFPANTGREGATLEIYEVDSDTGHRVDDEPRATFEIGADGDWGPVTVDSRKHYEFVLTADNSQSHHLYQPRFLRDDAFVRLLSGGPDSPTRMNSSLSDNHSNIVVSRMREWYAKDDADLEGDQTDVLEVQVKRESGDTEPVNVLTDDLMNGSIGIHVQDAAASPGDTTREPLPYFSMQAFQAGVDVFLPAADPPDGTIRVTSYPRGDRSRPQTLNVPNWPSSEHSISILLSDYLQD